MCLWNVLPLLCLISSYSPLGSELNITCPVRPSLIPRLDPAPGTGFLHFSLQQLLRLFSAYLCGSLTIYLPRGVMNAISPLYPSCQVPRRVQLRHAEHRSDWVSRSEWMNEWVGFRHFTDIITNPDNIFSRSALLCLTLQETKSEMLNNFPGIAQLGNSGMDIQTLIPNSLN